MTEAATETLHEESIDALRARAEALELQLRQAMDDAQARLARAELKAEAVRAGMVDLDGLKLIDPTEVKLSGNGDVEGAAQIMQRLKRAKPWLFSHGSTSSAAGASAARETGDRNDDGGMARSAGRGAAAPVA